MNSIFEEKRIELSINRADRSSMEMLDELVSLENVKEQIKRFVAFAKMKKNMVANGREGLPVTLNMEFVGNPGTAKTTVARLMAGILFENGLLESGEIIEVSRADLVGRGPGETAGNVQDIFRTAKGKVLFIDEACSLLEYWRNGFGDEAINAIVHEMEAHRNDTVVILAGYSEKMSWLMRRNPGLKSRVPYRLVFDDYSADEMLQIAELEAQKLGFGINEDGREKLLGIFREVAPYPGMGNGRFSRNMVESAIIGYSFRLYGEGSDADMPEDPALDSRDFRAPARLRKPGKSIMGFHCEPQNTNK